MGSDQSVTSRWKAALDEAERLQSMGDDERLLALCRLHEQAPERHAQVLALLSDATGASSVLDAPAFDMSAGLSADLTGLQVGPYRLLREIGAGGMGRVWLAERGDGRFESQVAVKLLAVGTHGTMAERFRREGHMLARMTHPHIARLLDAGALPSGQLYLVLEYVDGLRIDHYCDQQRLGLDGRVKLVIDVCEAVAHAHANLIVHRDLKPSNIMVTAGGTVKLLDFGIAKLLQAENDEAHETELTREGGRALTPEYAAPEQIAGGAVTTATDVYSLGVILYRLLSGGRPYRRTAHAAELARAITDEEPRALTAPAETLDEQAASPAELRATTPERLRQALRGDLETIVAKALKKQPAERYASMQALADDLKRHLSHEPVVAQPDSLAYRTGKFVRRNRWQVGALSAFFATLVAGIVSTAWQWQAASREADRTRSVVKVLTEVFTGLNPDETGSATVPVVKLLERSWAQAKQDLQRDPELVGEVARPLGLLLTTSGDSGMAAEALALARSHLLRTGRRLTTDYLDVTTELANLRLQQGQHAQTRELSEDVLAAAREAKQADAPSAIVAMSLLGSVLRWEQKPQAAVEQFALAADAARRKFGAVHATLARAVTEQADAERDQGHWERARDLYAAALQATPSDLKRGVAVTRQNAAFLDIELGRYAQAVESLKSLALEMDAVFGESSALTVVTSSWLAVASSLNGQYEASERAMKEALRKAQTAPEEGLLQHIQLRAAQVHLRRGDVEQAEALLTGNLGYFETRPDERVALGRLYAMYGEVHMHRGQFAEGHALLVKAAQLMSDVPDRQVNVRLPMLLRFAASLDLKDGPAAAQPLYAQAQALAQARLAAAHPERLRAEMLAAQAAWRAEPSKDRHAALMAALDAYKVTLRGRADLPAFSVYQNKLAALSPTALSLPDDVLRLLNF